MMEIAVLDQAVENKPFFRKGSTTAALEMRQQCPPGEREAWDTQPIKANVSATVLAKALSFILGPQLGEAAEVYLLSGLWVEQGQSKASGGLSIGFPKEDFKKCCFLVQDLCTVGLEGLTTQAYWLNIIQSVAGSRGPLGTMYCSLFL